MSLIIRKAETKDLDSLVYIEHECSGMPWSREQFIDELLFPLSHTYVAEVDGTVAGFFSMHVVSDDAHLNEFGVLKEYRRQGIGMSLAKQMLAICKENNCAVFSLEVRESSFPAISLYEKVGCKKAGIRKDFYLNPRENAIIYIMNFEDDYPEC
ncbi:MAG: ribosomal protein S18-alanine N-acetyltransferase [Oscillospiraceae bacterium]|nr:ribosomal protein S18-alanine N-acetyltransferase [Oscillospiraceae bacterium]